MINLFTNTDSYMYFNRCTYTFWENTEYTDVYVAKSSIWFGITNRRIGESCSTYEKAFSFFKFELVFSNTFEQVDTKLTIQDFHDYFLHGGYHYLDDALEHYTNDDAIYDFSVILTEHGVFWAVPQSTSKEEYIKFLTDEYYEKIAASTGVQNLNDLSDRSFFLTLLKAVN